MESLKYLYRFGKGPSSSHTMGPIAAAKRFLQMAPDADEYKAVLFGSLALTGKGHMTDKALKACFLGKEFEVVFDSESPTPVHPNTIDFYANKAGKEIYRKRFYSIGGGEVVADGESPESKNSIYRLNSFNDISAYCRDNNLRIWEYVGQVEGAKIWEYLQNVWKIMNEAISRGLAAEGVLPGAISVNRKARFLYRQSHIDESSETRRNRLLCSYAYAVSEENAAGNEIVTAPTCGSCGVIPAVLKFLQENKGFSDTQIIHALATGGIIGNLIKTNASISGAECGCQAEIGTACAMAAAAAGELYGLNLDQIEYAAEMSIEHHLGLTCDPVMGLVQIPCIERNAVAAMRALDAVNLADFLFDSRKISFDMIVKTMYETGKDLKVIYRETSQGGLAKEYRDR